MGTAILILINLLVSIFDLVFNYFVFQYSVPISIGYLILAFIMITFLIRTFIPLGNRGVKVFSKKED